MELEHPLIRAMERWGAPRRPRSACRCGSCGVDIPPGEELFLIGGQSICCRCVEACRRTAGE